MSFSALKEVKGCMVDFKKMFSYEFEVVFVIYDGKCHIEHEVSCFDTRKEDVESNYNV